MTGSDPYDTPGGAEQGIREAARRAEESDRSLSVSMRIRLEYFHRFLSRVFSEQDHSEWILKGGMSVLARVPSTRSTRDIDLYRQGLTLQEALDDVIRLAAIDLGDHFRFVYARHADIIGNEEQPRTEGCRVQFDIFIGLGAKGSLAVDLVVGAGLTGEVATMEPAGALDLPRMVSHRYRLYPVVDQIADKVCATMTDYAGRPSSREKDLVDLVVLAATQNIDGTALRRAIITETQRRQMNHFHQFAVPPSWGPGYAGLSRSVPYCDDYHTVGLAGVLLARLIDPALESGITGKKWRHTTLEWV